MKNAVGRFLTLLIITVFLWPIFFSSVSVNAQNGRKVKVGYFFDGDYMYRTTDGHYRGYDVEYLNELAKYTGWTYTYIEFDSFRDECAALQEGDIDIIPAFFYSDERSKLYDYSASDMGDVHDALIVDADDDKYAYDDYEAFNGMKVGILGGTIDGENFVKWCSDKRISVNTVVMDSNEELLAALKDGSIDGAAGAYMGTDKDYRIVAEFSPIPMYFALTRGNTLLKNELDEAMETSRISNPNFRYDLYRKYFSSDNDQKPVFTNSELAYLSKGMTATVVMQNDSPPFSWKDTNGRFSGAVVDMFSDIGKMSGLKFRYTGVDDLTEAMMLLKEGKAYIIARMTDDSVIASDYGILLTSPYMNLSLDQITKKNTRKIRRIAVSKSVKSLFAEKMLDEGNDYRVIYYPTARLCFEAMRTGKADAARIDAASASYLVNRERASAYSVDAMNSYDYSITVGVSNKTDKELYSITNKCVQHMSAVTMDDLIIGYTSSNDGSFTSFMNRIPMNVIVIIVAVLFVIVIMLIHLGIALSIQIQRGKRLALENEEVRKQEEAMKLAERTNQMKNDFFGNISHDMRTPLNAVLGYDRLALESKDEAKRTDYLLKIEKAGKLLLNLVNSTLMISKLENKKFELKMEPVNCDEMIHEVTLSISETASKKGLVFTSDCSAEHFGTVMTDRLNLQKILLNLLSNAVNYTMSGGKVEFIFRQMPAEPDGMNAQFIVRDSGIGISEKFLPKIFDPFTQERTSETVNVGGSGLGLSIVKQLVEMMGGTVSVKSGVGKGTEFEVRMYLEEISVNTEQDPEKRASERETIKGMHVLLCEDNEMNREIAITMLKAAGVSADTAENGKAGLDSFAESEHHEYDAILMDIRMPVMDGYAAARAIRALDRPDAGTVPIYAMSADAYEEDIRKCEEAGMNGHISKPVEAEVLYGWLEKGAANDRKDNGQNK